MPSPPEREMVTVIPALETPVVPTVAVIRFSTVYGDVVA